MVVPGAQARGYRLASERRTGRTSMHPERADGLRAATWIASFRSRASMRMKPTRCSFVSANGPSVMLVLPPRTRTVVAVFLGTRTTGGYAVDIVNTREAGGALVVQWQERRPARDVITAQVITTPAVIASIPKFAGEIRFEKVDK